MSSLPHTLRALGLLMILAAGVGSAEGKGPVQFPHLVLTDGRRFANVEVKSYDAITERFLVLTDRKLVLISTTLVPQPIRDRLKTEVPRRDSAVVAPLKPKLAKPAIEEKIPEPAAIKPAAPVATPPVNPDPSPSATDILDEHRALVLERAQKYYQKEFQAGSDMVRVAASRFEADNPEPVTGWPDRYRWQGRVQLDYLDRGGGRGRRIIERFEVLTIERPGEEFQVIDFSRK